MEIKHYLCSMEQTHTTQAPMLGQETKEFIAAHRNDDVRTLALQASRYPGVDIREAVTQIQGWQLAKEKLPAWAATDGIIYPVRLSMEQCSSEATARYKALLAQGTLMADLTGGFGIDCSYMARNFSRAIYIERNSALCDIARHNFALLGLGHIEIKNSACEDILDTLPHCDWIYADPARRDNVGGKVVALSDCEPDIPQLEARLMSRCNAAMIKCSPMLDITAACRNLRHIKEVHIIAVNNECKELLLILGHGTQSTPTALHCINILKEGQQQFITTIEAQQRPVAYTDRVKKYLYEPNAAIQKGGCNATLTHTMNIEKLHPNSHLFTSESLLSDFPGRTFIVERVSPFSKKEIKSLLDGIKQANITVRNFPDTVQGLRKRLKIAEGGDTYIFATTLNNGDKVLIRCRKPHQLGT